jgi:4-amino-4-deoxy-L-arabinose transferase-like glycosyltransferase
LVTKDLLLDSKQTSDNSLSIGEDDASRSVRHFLLLVTIIIAASAFCLFARAICVDVFTRAESNFAESAREMLVANQYLIPQYGGLPSYDKPILNYWLIDSAYKLLGVSLFSSRLHSIISAVACLSLVALVSRKLYGDRVAVLATAALGSSTMFLEMGTSSMSDMTLTLLEFSGLLLYFFALQSDDRKRTLWFSTAAFVFGLAFMQKGLPVLVLPGSSIVIFSLIFPNRIKIRDLLVGAVIFMATVVPWLLALYLAKGTYPLYYIFIRESFGRFLGATVQYNFGHPVYYMFSAFLSGFMPWSIFLPFTLYGLKSDWATKSRSVSYRLAMLLTILVCAHLVFFSFSKSNWGYYNLPALPAASILIAIYATRYLPIWAKKYRLPITYLPAVMFVCAIAASAYQSIFMWPAKAESEPPNRFSNALRTLSPGTLFVSHRDLAGQYFYSDLLLFKTGTLRYASDGEIVGGLGADKPFCAAVTQGYFNTLPSDLKEKVTILRRAQMKYLNFPGNKLVLETPPNEQIQLLLICNKSALASN